MTNIVYDEANTLYCYERISRPMIGPRCARWTLPAACVGAQAFLPRPEGRA